MSSNNVVWVMKYDKSYHVFYSGCMDNTPTKPDYKDQYYKEFKFRPNALLHAHNVVNKINELSLQEGFTYVEYGVCEITIKKEFDKLNFEKRLSNIDDHINTLNKESIETNTIVKKTLASWLEKNGERIVKEYVREYKPSLFMEMKFKENEKEIAELKGQMDGLKDSFLRRCLQDYLKKINNNEKVLRKLIPLIRNNFIEIKKHLKEKPFFHFEEFDALMDKLGGDTSDSEASMETDVGGKSEESQPPSCSHESHFISSMERCTNCENPLEQTVILTPKQIIEILDNEKMDCNKCDYYGECDHQGAYQKDGKWCYE